MQAKQGWQSYRRRARLVQRLQSLHRLTREELNAQADVCAICQTELLARVSPAGGAADEDVSGAGSLAGRPAAVGRPQQLLHAFAQADCVRTSCGHVYHVHCLQKWLYQQDTCPLCHRLPYPSDARGELRPVPPNVAAQ